MCMSNTTLPIKFNSHFAHCNGFDRPYKNAAYPGVVYSPSIKFIMENGAHWLVSDIMVCLRMVRKLVRSEFLTIKWNHQTQVVTYEDADPMTGDPVVLHCQKYDGWSDLKENLTFYAVSHMDGGRPCKLLIVRQEY